MTRTILTLLLCVTIMTTGCATYTISRQSLLQQFADTQPEKKSLIMIMPPYFFYYGQVTGNNLRQVTVLDKHGKETTIPVTIHTSVRITQTGGSRKTFYFNTLLIKDSTITGSKTHFFKAPIKPIYLKDVEKIELQKH